MDFYGVLIFFFNRAAFDLAPRKFIQQFRPRMNEILAEARAKIREIKKAKNEAKKQRKQQILEQKNKTENIIKFEEEEEEYLTDDHYIQQQQQ